ncbi:MAG TPA: acyl-CoA dehydrogenase family protein [Thermoanaerobaculia bacterium]|nr:acyl-CoA dehydrogenase family protein [Thermoanaerobaculia bacterium]
MNIFTREDLSPAQLMFGRIAEDFMRTEVLPRAEQIYAKDWSVTRELLLKAGELDLLRVDIPEEYGGLGLDKASSAYVGEKVGIMPSFAGSLGAHTAIGTLPLVYFGTEEQKQKYLPRLASGEMIAAFALTEPGSGSDALAARTKAVRDGDHYVLNGQKMWITNGGFADLFTIFAKVDGEKFTAFLVERSMGVVSGREEPKLGLDGSSTTALILENVRVPVENLLGTIGEGHKVAFNVLNIGRLKLGTRNIGGAKQSLNHAIDYAKQRVQFGRPIASFGLIRQKFAEMAIRCFVGDAMVYRTLGDADRAIESTGEVLKSIESLAVECSINKVWTSETLAYVVDEAVQVYGGYGYSKEYPAERPFRDARITRLYEGTNEINRLVIATRLLKRGVGSRQFAVDRMLDAAAAKFGDQLGEQQEILGHIADVAIESYAVESARLRAAKMRSAPHDVVTVYAYDAANRIAHSARQVFTALDMNEELPVPDRVDTVAARRRVAEMVIGAGKYPW